MLNSTELYDPATGSFTAGPAMNTARWEATATQLPNGKVLIAGGGVGLGGFRPLNSTELYDPATNTFAAGPAMNSARFDAANPMNAARSNTNAVVLPDSQVLIAGGDAGNNPQPGLAPLSTTDLYTE